jgi:O-Antigen ligase
VASGQHARARLSGAGELQARLSGAGDVLTMIGAALLVGLLALAALQRVGFAGLAAPFVVAAAILALRMPVAVLFGAVGLAIIAEPDGGLFPADRLYQDVVKGITPLDLLFALGTIGAGLRILHRRTRLVLPPQPLAAALGLLLLALICGLVVGRASGVDVPFDEMVLSVDSWGYLLVLPFVIVNLGMTERQVKLVLFGAGVLGLVKGLLGLLLVASGRGLDIEGGAVLTYYEPVANWVTMLVALTVVAALLLRARPPLWLLITLPVVSASLVLSYRRSFWIATALALAVVLLLGLASTRRRLAIPIVALLAVAVWMLGSVAVQSDTPLGQRLQSLSPSSISAKAEDRYRFDERANVVAALREHPITGLGVKVPWQATERSLPVEVNPDHTYVHFAALYWWLKLGVLGLAAFLAMMASALALSWRVWRSAREPLLRAVGLASLAAFVGLLAIESTASFTGIESRFTFAFAAQLGLLAVIARQSRGSGLPARS